MNSLLQFLTQSFGPILQNQLFPALREELGPMSNRHEQFVCAVAMLQLDGFVAVRHGRGRPGHDRASIARAFVAKAVFNVPTTRAILDRPHSDAVLRRLCGWETVAQIPDETVFSRAFAEFAQSEFPQRVHAALVQRTQSERLIGHILRDSTAIEAREKPQPQVAPTAPPPRRSHHKSKKPKSPEQMTRLDRQCSGTMTLGQMLADLPRACDVGCKTNSKGSKSFGIGFKLHMDAADGQIPISCLLTSASLNDTQAAVPLSLLTAQRVISLYDLMDAGYDADQIRQQSVSLGHIPIIPRRKLGSEPAPVMDPHQRVRFRERTAVERVFSRLRDEFGGRFVRVRGWAKVMAHLMFGILALTVDQILCWSEPQKVEGSTVPT